MNILLTGGTGFLGKHVLEKLISSPEVKNITLITRRKITHPSDKVNVFTADIAEPGSLETLTSPFDTVIYLAGAYDFDDSYEKNYSGNVFALSLFLKWIEDRNPEAFIHFASTYAAGALSPANQAEEKVDVLPGKEHPYAHTKALAEISLMESDLPHVIYRLGILVGDQKTGEIEKVDGPYYVIKLLKNVAPPA